VIPLDRHERLGRQPVVDVEQVRLERRIRRVAGAVAVAIGDIAGVQREVEPVPLSAKVMNEIDPVPPCGAVLNEVSGAAAVPLTSG
jgi:hypothetical protein